MAFVVAIELGAGVGEDAEVVEAVVIEVAGGDGDRARDLFEAGVVYAARCRCDRDERRSGDQARRSVWPVPVASITSMPVASARVWSV